MLTQRLRCPLSLSAKVLTASGRLTWGVSWTSLFLTFSILHASNRSPHLGWGKSFFCLTRAAEQTHHHPLPPQHKGEAGGLVIDTHVFQIGWSLQNSLPQQPTVFCKSWSNQELSKPLSSSLIIGGLNSTAAARCQWYIHFMYLLFSAQYQQVCDVFVAFSIPKYD